MKTVITISELQQALAELERPHGFVPTMGYLHEGHLSLVRRARQENPTVVVSIFANPTQFGPDEDLDSYPRDIDRDLELLSGVGADLVWIPSVQVMYPEGFQTWVEVEGLTKVLEGAYRPTHFRGVTTVVAKLFNAVGPERAYFGQKDAQQAAVLRQMVRDLNYQIEMVICPIVREPDGLAMSSRNTYLTAEERQAALCLSRGLSKAQDAFQEGIQDAEMLRDIVRKEINKEQLAELQYVSCADPETLQELDGQVQRCLISMAVYVGKTRLIDNRLIGI
ncbi:MAG: pantoate--beta-alanine ligase [Anaerolineales bacterium]